MSLFSKPQTNKSTKKVGLPTKNENNNLLIYSPTKGEPLPLSSLSDSVFRTEMIGKTIAINPSIGKIFSPISGTVSSISQTLHAISITTNKGLEILIHVGEDSIYLNRKYFKAKVKENDFVCAGDLLLEFDIDTMVQEGFSATTCLVILEPKTYKSITQQNKNKLSPKQILITISEY